MGGGGLYTGAGSDMMIIAHYKKLTFTIVYWLENLSKQIIFIVFNCFIHCFRLTNAEFTVELDIPILGWAYTRRHSQFWNLLKTWWWDFTRRWDYSRVIMVLVYIVNTAIIVLEAAWIWCAQKSCVHFMIACYMIYFVT